MNNRTQKVLDWVNERRTEWGLPTLAEMPSGKPCDADECSLARALSGMGPDDQPVRVRVGVHQYFVNGDSERDAFRLPGLVNEWRREFDRGEIPELIAHEG